MSDFLERAEKLSPRRLALLAAELHDELEAARAAARAPVAVVGMGCRLPGADSPSTFWELLDAGRDAVREVPRDRWDLDAWYDPDPDAPGRMSVRGGGFLDRVDGFDAAFFGVSGREAQTLDPQQRLLLEVAWEALEDAGIAPDRLAGSATGVFVGVCNGDHFQRVLARGVDAVDMYLASGNAHSVTAGRIAYVLGLQGPALAVDTACSSSLVALHLAVRSLRAGESRLALCGGVNVMCAPEITVALSKGHMLAPDGRCKAFDAAADGFSRGEGCGVLVLKRLDDAVADGDRVLAVIRGTAVNQDGRSAGLTVPSGAAQEAVIRAALADAGAAPAEVSYVEAHGTGTPLGDPIELRALGAAMGEGRAPGDPLLVGSVKTNLGHLESAAGVAGVMKVVLALQAERLPRHLHFRTPTPHVAWSDLPLRVLAEPRPWPRGARRRLAGVSSFGFSGTNAHVVLEEAPAQAQAAPAPGATDRAAHVLPLSARTPAALQALAARHAAALDPGTGPALADAAHTAAVGRAALPERLAVVAASADEARAALQAAASGAEHPALRRGRAAPGEKPEVVFLFTGQGAQYPGMGRALYDGAPAFREVVDRCAVALGPDAAGRTLQDVMFGPPGTRPALHDTAWTQPALFALELGLCALWRSWGIAPAAVIGHSAGEYAAACAAGVFGLEEGLRLVAERGRLMQALPPGGLMAAVNAPIGEVEAAVAAHAGQVAVAAYNAPDAAVISGEAPAVEAILAALQARQVEGHRLHVGLAAHSPLMAPALEHMEAAARRVPMCAPAIPVAWNVTGGAPLPGGAPDAVYWRRHLREPVRFADGLAALHRDGHRLFLEVGPHPVLAALAERAFPEGVTLLGSLRRGHDDWRELLSALGALWTRGVAVDWAAFDAPYGRRRVPLPGYPFERRRFWIEPGERLARGAAPAPAAMPGRRLDTALPCFECALSPETASYVRDHRLHGEPLVAGPVYLELAQAAARAAHGPAPRAVCGFTVHQPLLLPPEGRTVQVQLGAPAAAGVPFTVHARPVSGDGPWQLHASGALAPDAASAGASGPTPATIAADLGPGLDLGAHRARLAALGVDLGPAFFALEAAWRRDGEALVQAALPEAAASDPVVAAHPALVDAALQAAGLTLADAGGDLFLFAGAERIAVRTPLPARLWCHARLRPEAGDERRADVAILGADGAPLGEARGVTLRRAPSEARPGAAPLASYRVVWEPAPPRPRAAPRLTAPEAFVPALRDRFTGLAAEHRLALYDALLPELDALAVSHVVEALRALGFDATTGRAFDAAGEAARLGVTARHARLFDRLLHIAAEEGFLHERASGWEVSRPLPAPGPLDAWYEAALARFAGAGGELSMLRRCGGALAAVLRGEQDALQLLFPGGELREARRLYEESPFARTYGGAVAEALRLAMAGLPAGARLRVLELGAGTGGTTAALLPLLPPDRAEYTFTDVSPLFLERAASRFADRPDLRRALLDAERDPAAQGFEPGAWDVVVAANVLHATRDLRRSLEHARRLLAPGGLLLLLEGTAPERWVDLTFGLTEGWWRFEDRDLRPDYALLERERWVDLLTELGFTGAAAVPEGPQARRRSGQQALIVARAPLARRRVTVAAAPDDRVAEALAARLRARGDAVEVADASAPERPGPTDELVYLGASPLGGRALDDPAAPAASAELAAALPLRWLGRLARAQGPGRAWLVTRGAAGDGRGPDAPWQAPLWGAGRTFALEEPSRFGGLVDLDPEAAPDACADALAAALDDASGEDQVAWRGGVRLAARLARAPAPEGPEVRVRPDATYLITGGFGGLGLRVARWLAERGARHLALLGRRPAPDAPEVRALADLGARVLPVAADVGDAAALEAALQRLRADAPPVAGVIHAAADLSAAPVAELRPEQIVAMLRPKVAGTVALERLTRGPERDFLALFSSTTALLGAAGLAHYGAANAFLDAFAASLPPGAGRVVSIGWGTWEVMRLASASERRSYLASGLEPMAAGEALAALGRIVAGDERHVAVARIDWATLRPLHEARRARPMLSRQSAAPATPEASAAPAAGGTPPLLTRLAAAVPAARPGLLLEWVRGEVAAVLGAEGAAAVAPDTGLFDLGMDSLMSVELRRRLERGAGRALPSTLTFNHPSAAALAAFLGRALETAPSPAPTPPDSVSTASNASSVEPGPTAAAGELGALSDEELEARLLASLERTR